MPHPILSLPLQQRRKAIKELNDAHRELWRTERRVGLMPCPYCKNENTQRNGHRANGLKLFVCPKCKKAYSERTGTCFHYAHLSNRMEQYADLMSQGYLPLKEMANLFRISIQTAFEWRHKILNAIKYHPEQFSGKTEMQSISMPFSRKGYRGQRVSEKPGNQSVKLLLLADENNNTAFSLCRIGGLKASDISSNITNLISKAKSIESIAVNAFTEYSSINQHLPIRLHELPKAKISDALPVTNRLSDEIQSWVHGRMHGVSTKYLSGYAHWFRHINSSAPAGMKSEFIHRIHSEKSAWGCYAGHEFLFKRFLAERSETKYCLALERNWRSSKKLLLLNTKLEF